MIRHRPHDWHVQVLGQGPTVVLLHGTGGSTHSWRDLAPVLAERFRVVLVDLPGHGFTKLGSRQRSGLDTVTQDIEALLLAQDLSPVALVGHSAGAAVALRLSHRFGGLPVVGINPALAPFPGLAGVLFPVAARMMAMTPFLVDAIVRTTRHPGRVVDLINGTGSTLSAHGLSLYAQLFKMRSHIDGTLLMMSQWSLEGMIHDLPKYDMPCLFLTGGQDKTVPPTVALEAAKQMPRARVEPFEGYGHLLHEEVPRLVASRIIEWLDAQFALDVPSKPAQMGACTLPLS